MFNTDDRYFAAGLVGAVAALYAASMFAFFSSEGVQVAQQSFNQDENRVAVISQAVPANEKQMRTILGEVAANSVFAPLGRVSPIVPGIHCSVNDMNLDTAYSFRNIPLGCSQIFTEE